MDYGTSPRSLTILKTTRNCPFIYHSGWEVMSVVEIQFCKVSPGATFLTPLGSMKSSSIALCPSNRFPMPSHTPLSINISRTWTIGIRVRMAWTDPFLSFSHSHLPLSACTPFHTWRLYLISTQLLFKFFPRPWPGLNPFLSITVAFIL